MDLLEFLFPKMTYNWEQMKTQICKLYLDQHRTLKDVQRVMMDEYEFNARYVILSGACSQVLKGT